MPDNSIELSQAVSTQLARWRARVDSALDALLPDPMHPPHRLHAAMRHAVLQGGKRMRPLLVYATGTALSADETELDAAAAAVELVHAYSLVHDDLPAMDNDSLRRGQPTVHVAFDEATAILAGDALQAMAFQVLADAPQPPAQRVALLQTLAAAAGAAGMCGGQALDIDATGSTTMDSDLLERLHGLKTGALLRACVRLGALIGGADAGTLQRLDAYAQALGLAFQIRDDLLDVQADTQILGKTAGKDVDQAKATFSASLGIQASQQRLRELAADMQSALTALPIATDTLAALARMAIERDR